MDRNWILLVIALLVSGCAGNRQASPVAATTPSPAASTDGPRTVTDLSQISRSGQVAAPLPDPGLYTSAETASKPDQNAIVQQNIERLVVANADQARYHEGRAAAPGETILLNDAAKTFSDFSYQLLNQTLTAARAIEPDRLEGRKLPLNIGPTVLTAVMDSNGRLKEISIEAHSGDHQVDQIIIEACKQGLWSRNPPAQALDADGKYRLRVRGRIRAYMFDYKGQYHYDTELGLAIL